MWAAHRWAGRAASILTAASPPTLVSRLPLPLMGTVPMGGEVADLPPEALIGPRRSGPRPPSVDPLPLVLAAARLGPALVVTPSVATARRTRRTRAALRRGRRGAATRLGAGAGGRRRHDRRPQRGVGPGAPTSQWSS